MDMDIDLQAPLDSLVHHNCVFAEEKVLSDKQCREFNHDHKQRIANYMFGAVPGHPFIAHLISELTKQSFEKKIGTENVVLETTGPGMVTMAFHHFSHKHDITVLQSDRQCEKCGVSSCSFGNYAHHLHEGSWRWEHRVSPSMSAPAPLIKHIHQTWKTRKLSGDFKKMHITWGDKHPDWECHLWTDEDNRNLIKNHYGWFLETYDQYPYEIQRVDAARYFILYTLGGLYVDLDFKCIKNIEPLLDESELVLGLENPEHSKHHQTDRIIGNAFMYASQPGSPLLRQVIEALADPIDPHENQHSYVLESTGPMMLSRVYEAYTAKEDIKLLSADLIYPIDYLQAEEMINNPVKDIEFLDTTNAYAVHYHCGTWWKPGQNQD